MRYLGWQKVALRLIGIALSVGGIVLIIEVIPREFWYVCTGSIMIFVGWILFNKCD